MKRRRSLGDFIEEDGSPLRLFEQADAGGGGAGIGPFRVSEEIGFGGLRIEGTDRDGKKRGFPARAVGVNGSGDEFLSGSSLAGDEYGDFGLGHESDLFEDRLHGGRDSEQGFLDAGLGEGMSCLMLSLFREQSPANDGGGLLEIERFGEVVEGPFGDGADGGFEVTEGGDDDHGGIVGSSAQFRECGQAVHAGKSDIEDDGVEFFLVGQFDGFLGG